MRDSIMRYVYACTLAGRGAGGQRLPGGAARACNPESVPSALLILIAQGVVQAAGVCLAVLHARFALFEVLQRLMGGRPTEAVLAGCLLLGAAAGCAPILACQFPYSVRARRWLAIVAAAGALLVLLRPPLPTQVCLQFFCAGGRLLLSMR